MSFSPCRHTPQKFAVFSATDPLVGFLSLVAGLLAFTRFSLHLESSASQDIGFQHIIVVCFHTRDCREVALALQRPLLTHADRPKFEFSYVELKTGLKRLKRVRYDTRLPHLIWNIRAALLITPTPEIRSPGRP